MDLGYWMRGGSGHGADLDLIVAIRRGHPSEVRKALDLGADPDPGRTDPRAVCPLHLASSTGGKEVICSILLQAGARPSPVGAFGETPLQAAVRIGCSRTVAALLDGGADPNIGDINGDGPIRFAVHSGRVDLVRRLAMAGAYLDAPNLSGRTALHDAARIGDDAMIRLLVELGACVMARDDSGGTPLHAMATIINMALPGGTPRPPVPMETVAILASEGALLVGDINGNEPLHIAAASANPEMCRALLELGADPDSTNKQGRTPLGCARGPARYLLGRFHDARKNGPLPR